MTRQACPLRLSHPGSSSKNACLLLCPVGEGQRVIYRGVGVDKGIILVMAAHWCLTLGIVVGDGAHCCALGVVTNMVFDEKGDKFAC